MAQLTQVCEMLYLILSVIVGSVVSIEMTFTLQEHEVQCFHEHIPKDKEFTLEYQVISGGHFDIDCSLASPNSKTLYKEQRKQYDSFTHKTVEEGEYTFCFSNEFSTFAHKTVYFDLDLGEEDGYDFDDEEGAHATALTQLESSAYSIHESLRLVVDYQNHHRLKERIGREVAEYLCERVQNWSIGQTVLIVIVAFGQVFMLRRLFDKPVARSAMKCLIVAALVLVAYSEITEEENVLVLTEDNFEEAMIAHKQMLLEFYAPWCEHCKALAPEYARAATILKNEGSDVKLAKVDATSEKGEPLAEKFNVEEYPSIAFLSRGSAPRVFLSDDKTASGIVTWIKKITGDPFEVVTTVKEVQDALKKFVLLGAFKDRTTEAAKAFIEVAGDHLEITFLVTENDDVMAEYGLNDGGAMIIRNFPEEEPNIHVEGDVTSEAVWNLIKHHTLPILSEFTDESSGRILNSPQRVHHLLFVNGESEEFADLLSHFRAVCKTHNSEIIHVLVDTSKEDGDSVLEFFGVAKDTEPTTRIVNMRNMEKFAFPPREITVESLATFEQNYLDDKLVPYLNSQILPEDWDSKPVKVLVADNIMKVAHDETKDVFVEFYAPWCGHCQKLEPVWDELGEKYKDHPTVVIAKIDATINEFESINVLSYPTIKFFPKESGTKMVKYTGEQTLEAFVAFLDGPHDDLPEDDGLEDYGEETEEGETEEDDEDDDEDEDDEDDDEKDGTAQGEKDVKEEGTAEGEESVEKEPLGTRHGEQVKEEL